MSALNEFKASFEQLLKLRVDRDIKKTAAEKAEEKYRAKEAELFAELQEAGIRGRHAFDFGPELGLAKFQRRSTIFGRVVDRAAAIASLKAKGLDDAILQEAVQQGRLNEIVRDLLESKQDLPDGIDFYSQDRITISRK